MGTAAEILKKYGHPAVYPEHYPGYHWEPIDTGHVLLPGDEPGTSSPPPSSPPPPNPPSPDPTTPGIDPSELKNATYGKKIPISALGLSRIGGNIIFGPYLNGTTASFGISFGFPADPTGTRELREIALDSKVAWTLADGFTGDPFTYRFYPGTQTQEADPLEIANFPDAPIAYRPQQLLFFEDLPLAPFNNKIPYVAAVIGDTTDGANPADGINLGEALERIAWSPWTLYDSSIFETVDIVDVVGGILLADDYTFLQLCQYIGRIYRNLDILQSDKLRVRDHGALVDPDISFNPGTIVTSGKPVQFVHQEPSLTPRELELVTIDPDADYTWVPAKAQRPRVPIPTTASVGKDTVTLPLVLNNTTRISMAYFAQYAEESARKKVSFTTMAYGLNVQPGDRVALTSIADGIDDEVFKITQTTCGANHVVQVEAESIMRCSLGPPSPPPPPPPPPGTGTTWNPADKATTITLSNGDLSAVGNQSTFTPGSVRGQKYINAGKAYFEVIFTGNTNISSQAGVANAAKDLTFSYSANAAMVEIFGGQIYINNTSPSGGLSAVLPPGGAVCIALDMGVKRIWFRFDGGLWNNSGSADPATNVGGFDVSAIFAATPAYPCAAVQVTVEPVATANFGASAFAQTIPSGFVAWNSA